MCVLCAPRAVIAAAADVIVAVAVAVAVIVVVRWSHLTNLGYTRIVDHTPFSDRKTASSNLFGW